MQLRPPVLWYLPSLIPLTYRVRVNNLFQLPLLRTYKINVTKVTLILPETHPFSKVLLFL